MKTRWVKKRISKKDWSSQYSHSSSYCYLKNEGDTVLVGFCIPYEEGGIPESCMEVDQYDLSRMQAYRIRANVRPLPLGDVDVEQENEVNKENVSKLDRMRSYLKEKLKLK